MRGAEGPVVMKIGGSLEGCVPELAETLRESPRPVLVVPGGGRFADAVRGLPVSDDAAHWSAIAAMDQYGWYIADHGLPASTRLRRPQETTVLLPYCAMRRHDALLHTWDVTSDTIAAWVAHLLDLDLVLVKSVDGISRDGALLSRVSAPCTTDAVDPCLIRYVLGHGVRTVLINGRAPHRVRRFLNRQPVPSTVIDTRF